MYQSIRTEYRIDRFEKTRNDNFEKIKPNVLGFLRIRNPIRKNLGTFGSITSVRRASGVRRTSDATNVRRTSHRRASDVGNEKYLLAAPESRWSPPLLSCARPHLNLPALDFDDHWLILQS